MVTTAEAEAPRGLRLYAIGDIHGCLGQVEAVHCWIDADLARRPPLDWRIIHLGDYVDRGPDSRGVLDLLIRRMRRGRCYCLRGNHDQFLIDFLADPEARSFGAWVAQGGLETLSSYGLDAPERMLFEAAGRRALRHALIERMPAAHQRFLTGLPHLIRFGDYAFAHAGIRPGVPLAEQTANDLIWIREPFLSHTGEMAVVTVHGHTPEDRIMVAPHRVGIDTGAVHGGSLACLVIEGRALSRLGPWGPLSLTATAGYH